MSEAGRAVGEEWRREWPLWRGGRIGHWAHLVGAV